MGEVTKTRKLTAKQQALVETLVARGCTIKEAAEAAGYAKGEAGRVSASRALALPHVQEALSKEMIGQFGIAATAAAGRLRHLSQRAKSEYVQLEASKDLLDRAGFKPIERKQVQGVGELSIKIDLG